jgi:Ser/Thr protein kinase RdoA (MazF antagonist)
MRLSSHFCPESRMGQAESPFDTEPAGTPAGSFAALTPDVVLDALETAGLAPDGRLLMLSSYENRVWMAHLDDGSAVVAKFYRPEQGAHGQRWSTAQILEEHAFAAELAAAEIPVVAPLELAGATVPGSRTLAEHGGFRFSVSPRRGGRAPELDDPAVLEWIGRFLARIHSVGAARSFSCRERLDIAAMGEAPLAWLMAEGDLPPTQRETYRSAAQQALDAVRECFAAAGAVAQIRLHGDCHPGNILWTPEGLPQPGPHFVDLDDARTGPAVQDLWMLASGDRADQTRQWSALVDGYETMREFDRRELHLVEALRTLRQIHYAAWLARRRTDPAFTVAFPWFGTDAYWAGQAQQLREQCESMVQPALMI